MSNQADERKQQIIQETKIEANALAAVDETTVLQMMEKGVLVHLHIRYWRPYTQLNERDLGIQGTQELKQYVHLGRKKLLPPKLIAKIETVERRARTALKNHSLKCFWGSLIPTTAWPGWREQSDKLRKKFFEVRDEVVKALPESLVQLREIYTQMAIDAYKRMQYDQDAVAPQEFVENFVTTCLRRIPTQEEISEAFSYEEVYNYIPLPSQVRAHMQGIWEDEMHRQIAEAMWKQRREMMATFLAEVGVGLRNMVSKVCQSVHDSIKQNNGKLIPRAASDLRRLIEKLERLNFHDDKEVTKMVQEIRVEIDKPSAERDVPNLSTAIDSVLIECNEQIRNIVSQVPSRFDFIDLSEPSGGTEEEGETDGKANND